MLLFFSSYLSSIARSRPECVERVRLVSRPKTVANATSARFLFITHLTRSSPQRSGCSTTTHIAFTHLGLWRKYDCSLHHFTTSQCILKCTPLTVSSTSNRLADVLKTDFSTNPGFGGLEGTWGSGMAYSLACP